MLHFPLVRLKEVIRAAFKRERERNQAKEHIVSKWFLNIINFCFLGKIDKKLFSLKGMDSNLELLKVINQP